MSEAARNYNISAIASASPNVTGSPKPLPTSNRPVNHGPKPPERVLARIQKFEHGQGDGLDRVSRKNMRRGKVKVEGRLDLHGMIQAEAHRNLLVFLEHAYLSGRRCVLVITGKGMTLNGETGVLRNAVPGWLNEHPVNQWIRGFDYAAPADGGQGALYVLLRRKK